MHGDHVHKDIVTEKSISNERGVVSKVYSHRDVDELDEITNETHHSEANGHGLGDLDEF